MHGLVSSRWSARLRVPGMSSLLDKEAHLTEETERPKALARYRGRMCQNRTVPYGGTGNKGGCGCQTLPSYDQKHFEHSLGMTMHFRLAQHLPALPQFIVHLFEVGSLVSFSRSTHLGKLSHNPDSECPPHSQVFLCLVIILPFNTQSFVLTA